MALKNLAFILSAFSNTYHPNIHPAVSHLPVGASSFNLPRPHLRAHIAKSPATTYMHTPLHPELDYEYKPVYTLDEFLPEGLHYHSSKPNTDMVECRLSTGVIDPSQAKSIHGGIRVYTGHNGELARSKSKLFDPRLSSKATYVNIIATKGCEPQVQYQTSAIPYAPAHEASNADFFTDLLEKELQTGSVHPDEFYASHYIPLSLATPPTEESSLTNSDLRVSYVELPDVNTENERCTFYFVGADMLLGTHEDVNLCLTPKTFFPPTGLDGLNYEL